ncbi:hypothetical protein [Limosilactobacillus caviae]|uniref:Uncharacterized protein n=1 Tax=Limosilactobacillus caviae TaxID=1769424 RepID=A0ABQ2C421_9LACO|nr:hypothetical protein [Limosilactobacillus caviae]GGI62785.1 hypothetical protein GCM10011459_06190 [Limosilactobacillus caviae]
MAHNKINKDSNNKSLSDLKTTHLNIDADATEEERKEIIKWFEKNFREKDE